MRLSGDSASIKVRHQHDFEPSVPHSTFYQGKSQDDEQKQQQECLCSKIHHFQACPGPTWLKEKRTSDWDLDHQRQDKIDEKLYANEKLKRIID